MDDPRAEAGLTGDGRRGKMPADAFKAGVAYQIIISSFKLFRQHFGAGEAKPFPHIHLMVHAGLVDGLGITGDASASKISSTSRAKA